MQGKPPPHGTYTWVGGREWGGCKELFLRTIGLAYSIKAKPVEGNIERAVDWM